jgi:hypothetical protein
MSGSCAELCDTYTHSVVSATLWLSAGGYAELCRQSGVDQGLLMKAERAKFIRSHFFVLLSSSDKDHVQTQRMVA